MSKALDGFEPLEIKRRKAWYMERIEQLEQLCRDVWTWANYPYELTEGKALHDRMDALGLLEGENNV